MVAQGILRDMIDAWDAGWLDGYEGTRDAKPGADADRLLHREYNAGHLDGGVRARWSCEAAGHMPMTCRACRSARPS